MVDILRTGLSGLLAFQRSLATTGHNIANLNTPNYSRQRVDLTTMLPQDMGTGFIGRGVDVAGVRRVYDDFLVQQMRDHGAGVSQSETLSGLLDQVSGLVGDANTGLSSGLQQFFSAVQDVADSPGSVPIRQVMLSQGESLAAGFQNMDRQLSELREGVNRGLQTTVSEINQLAEAIAATNRDIVQAQGSAGAPPNDLLDYRDSLLADLSQRVAVQTVPQTDGALNVFIGTGQALVLSDRFNQLEVSRSAVDPQNLEIRQQGQTPGTDLSAQLTGGQVGGYLTFRNEILDPAQSSLGLLAMGLAETLNAQHRQGMDLNGELGGDFFQAGAPRVLANANNSGTAALTATIDDIGQLQPSDYEVRYDGANFSVRRLADNTVVANGPAGPFTVDGLTVAVDSGAPAAGDRFLIQPTRQGAADFAVAVTDAREIAAALPITTASSQGNLGTASISSGAVMDSTDPDLRRAVEIQFTSPTTFDAVDTATGTALTTGQPYASGDPIAFNGWEVYISGDPQAGDSFQVTDNAGGVGDNRNALALAGLQSTPTLLNSTSDYQGLYAQMVAEVGAQGSRSQSILKSQEALLDQATQAREAISGVNLDEEAADLMRFQQAYEASAQVIQVANSLFDTLLNAVRR